MSDPELDSDAWIHAALQVEAADYLGRAKYWETHGAPRFARALRGARETLLAFIARHERPVAELKVR